MDERELIEQKIRDLKSLLSSPASDIGDWKIAKCMEYQAVGLPAPYDLEELSRKRQEVRDEINRLMDQIEALEVRT